MTAAEDYPAQTPSRLAYDPGDGLPISDGAEGLMRALEPIDLRNSRVSSAVLIPGILEVVQLIMDAVGGGPKPVLKRNLGK